MADQLPEIIPPAPHQVPRVVEALATVPWAITDEALATIVAIAGRENEISPEALEAMRARRVANSESLQMRGNVAILRVSGPMFRYADMFTAISGGATYEGIARDVERYRADASMAALLIAWDTPGGEVNGCAELAGIIRAVAQEKPIESYVGGQCCSGGYWLAAATSRITIDPTAILGSIGVKIGIRDSREREAKSGVRTIEFVSSNAPNKRTDFDTDAGRARIQRTADQLEAVFLNAVALNRGVSVDEVIAKFGAGGVEVGADAVEAGLADKLGSFEGVLSTLARGDGRRITQGRIPPMAENTPAGTFTQAQLDDASRKAANDAQTRIAAIMDSDAGKTRPALARHLAFKTTMSAEDAVATLAASAVEAPATATAPAPVVTPPAPAAPAPVAQAPAGTRAQDVAGGLALATVVDGKPGTEEKPKGPVASSIYKTRAKAMNQSAH